MRLRSGRPCQRAGNSVHRRQERPKPRLVSAGDRTSAVARSILRLAQTCTVERAKRLTGAERPALGSATRWDWNQTTTGLLSARSRSTSDTPGLVEGPLRLAVGAALLFHP